MSDAPANSSSPLATCAAPRGWKKWAIAVTVGSGAILGLIDVNRVGVALRYIQGSLEASGAEVGWIMHGYALANVLSFAITAGLGDRLGRKTGFIFSLLAFLLASILCGLASSPSMLIFSRVLQGLSGGAMLATAQSILLQTFSTVGQVAVQMAAGLSAIVMGPLLGPTLGGYLCDTFSWRQIFFINVPFGIVLGILAVIFLPADDPHRRKRPMVEWIGIALMTAGLAVWNFSAGGPRP